MTTTPIARVLDNVRVHVPAVMDGMMRLELFNALKEFFQRSNIWLLEIPVYVTPESNDYQVETGMNVVVNRLMELSRPNQPLANQWEYAPTRPPAYFQVDPNNLHSESVDPIYRSARRGTLLNAGTKCPILRIIFNPQVAETWIATLALNITDPTDQDGLPCPPEWIVEKYSNYLIDGVIMRLMLQPGKPYSSPQGAQYHGRKFNEGVGLARTEARNMFVYNGQRWFFPQGWSERRPRKW